METDNHAVETYDPSRLYRAPKGPAVGTMEIPTHLAPSYEHRQDAEDLNDLEFRKSAQESLMNNRKETGRLYRLAEKNYNDFQELIRSFRDADNAKNPTAEQSAVIRTLNESVSSIVLTGGSTLNPLVRRMTQKGVQLKEARDAALKSWNAACKECTENQGFMTKLEDRINKGKAAVGAVQGNVMHYLPGFDGVSMEKPFLDVARDLWSLVEGPAMLNLNFGSLQAVVSRLLKSARAEVHSSTPGSDAHRNALLRETAVTNFHDTINSTYGRTLSKKAIVERMLLLNTGSLPKSTLQQQLQGHMSGITKLVMTSPCCDCPGGKSVNRALQDQNGRSSYGNYNQNNRGGFRGGYRGRGGYQRNSYRGRFGNSYRPRGRGGYWRGGRGGFQSNTYSNGNQYGGYQRSNSNYSTNQANNSSSTGKKGFYCNIHGPGSTHDWAHCFLNKSGQNFKAAAYATWEKNNASGGNKH